MAMKIDTSTWKPFRVGDLFDVLLAKGDIQPNLIDDGDVPLVSAGTVDNGIVAMISDKGDGISEVFPAGCLTVSMFGTAFWQTETFYAVSHGRVNVLMPKCRVSDTVGLFLASAVNARFNGEYDYSTMCTRKRLLDATVTLPATSDGAPDWAYMETYMQHVFDREEMFAKHLASLTAEAVADGHVIDTSAWKAFRMTDGLGFVCHHGSRLNKSVRIDGDIPFITAGFENRGVSQFIGNDVAVYSDAITVDMFGNCFFQQGRCAGDDNVYFFVNDAISHYCKLFLSSAVHASVANCFDYSSQFRQSDADSLSVLLPAASDGAPDWVYMEQYMKNVMAVEALFADELDQVYAM